MRPITSNTLIVLAALTSLVATVALRSRPGLRLATLVLVTTATWGLLVAPVRGEAADANRRSEERLARGGDDTADEALADGTGDNVAALLFGWFPAAAGATAGFMCLAAGRRGRPWAHVVAPAPGRE